MNVFCKIVLFLICLLFANDAYSQVCTEEEMKNIKKDIEGLWICDGDTSLFLLFTPHKLYNIYVHYPGDSTDPDDMLWNDTIWRDNVLSVCDYIILDHSCSQPYFDTCTRPVPFLVEFFEDPSDTFCFEILGWSKYLSLMYTENMQRILFRRLWVPPLLEPLKEEDDEYEEESE